MKSIVLYAAIFGIPMVLYAVWLARFTRQLAFPLLLIFAVVTVWGSLWPLHFGPEHWRVTGEMIGDEADAVVNGFALMGWIYGVLGCLPVLLVEIPRSVVLLIRKRRTK